MGAGHVRPAPPPLGFTIETWDVTSVTMSWSTNTAADTTIVQREIGGTNAWVTLGSWGPLASGTRMTFTDTAATAGSSNCYRVLAGNANGWSQWGWPDLRCVYTRDGRHIAVDRLELFVRIANTSDAGSDDPVQVRLQSPAWLVNWRPAGNATWVDTTADDDFDQGVGRWYELLGHNVKDLSDVTMITLDKPGSDAMCVAELALRINRNGPAPGLVVFRQVFGDAPSACRWVTEGSPLTMTIVDLHAAPEWQAAAPTPPAIGLTAEWLRAEIEAAFADTTHGTAARLHGGVVTTQMLSGTTLRVVVPLLVDTAVGDVQSSARFDLTLTNTCVNNMLHAELAATNPNVSSLFDSVPILDLLEDVLLFPVLSDVSETIEGSIHFSTTIGGGASCALGLRFTADGGIGLGTF